jgi:transposase
MGSIKSRKKFDRQFKIEAVNLVLKGERRVGEVAESLGIAPTVLYRWIRKFNAEPLDAFPGKGRLSAQEEEIRQLRRELERAKEDAEILKKALVYFSKDGK